MGMYAKGAQVMNRVRWKLVYAVCALVEHYEQIATCVHDVDTYVDEQIARFALTPREVAHMVDMLRESVYSAHM
jgi:hypothetical protein